MSKPDRWDEPAHVFVDEHIANGIGGVRYLGTSGLTKREAFTLAAMQGLCANTHAWEELNDRELGGRAAKAAEATLAELERREQERANP